MAQKTPRRRRKSKASLAAAAEMSRIDERIAVASYYGVARFGGGDLEEWLATCGGARADGWE